MAPVLGLGTTVSDPAAQQTPNTLPFVPLTLGHFNPARTLGRLGQSCPMVVEMDHSPLRHYVPASP
jgi:hypothetical protein